MMQIGPYTLANNVFLAPMVGVTDLPFRQVCRQLGAGLVVGEMTASDPALRGTNKSHYRGVHLQEPEPRSIQIVGYDAKMMADAAKYNVDQGASIIDINMGCPAKKVCRRAAGSALLADEPLVADILQAVVAAVDVPVTLKIRTGSSPNQRNGVTIAKIAEQCGVAALAVHGRTRACLFKGQAEYDTIYAIKQSVSIPVIANGDLVEFAQIKNVIQKTGVDAVMIGRGSYGRPWFLGQVGHYLQTGEIVPDPAILSQWHYVNEHIQGLYSLYGKQLGLKVARKHIKWYAQRHNADAHFLKTVVTVDDTAMQLQLVKAFYQQLHDQHDMQEVA